MTPPRTHVIALGWAIYVLAMSLAGCAHDKGLYLSDAQVLALDQTIQKQAAENERLRQAVLKECR